MKLIRTWGNIKRPWGFEVRADFDDNGKIVNSVLGFDKEPDQKEIDLKVAAEKARLEAIVPVDNSAMVADPKDAEIAELKAEITALKTEVASLKVKVIR